MYALLLSDARFPGCLGPAILRMHDDDDDVLATAFLWEEAKDTGLMPNGLFLTNSTHLHSTCCRTPICMLNESLYTQML